MIVDFEIGVTKFFGGIRQPVDVTDERSALEDQVQELEGLFEDFLMFINIMKQLSHTHAAHVKAAENFSWENN